MKFLPSLHYFIQEQWLRLVLSNRASLAAMLVLLSCGTIAPMIAGALGFETVSVVLSAITVLSCLVGSYFLISDLRALRQLSAEQCHLNVHRAIRILKSRGMDYPSLASGGHYVARMVCRIWGTEEMALRQQVALYNETPPAPVKSKRSDRL